MTTKPKGRRLSGITLIFALMVGCAALPHKPEAPRVSITAIELVEAGILEQRYQVKLRVQNPNDFDFAIRGVQFEIKLNGQSFVTGVSGNPVNVPRFGSAVLDVEAVSTLVGLTRQLKEMAESKTPAASYGVTGKVHLAQPAISLPFHEEGEIKLPWLEGQ